MFLLKTLDVLGFIYLEPIRWELVKMWLPANMVFVAMNVTGFYALQVGLVSRGRVAWLRWSCAQGKSSVAAGAVPGQAWLHTLCPLS